MRNMKVIMLLVVIIFLAFPLSGQCAVNVYLSLKANNQDIKGEGPNNTIECVYYEQGVTTPLVSSTGTARVSRQYAPILIRKRVDKSSPLLMKALAENQKIDGKFRFVRPEPPRMGPTGVRTNPEFYTVGIKNGRITSVKQYVPDTTVPANSNLLPLEEVTLVFQYIDWTYQDGGVTYADNVSGAK